MSAVPNYIDPALSNRLQGINRARVTTAKSSKQNSTSVNQRVASSATCTSNDYIDVLADSESDSDKEDPQTIQKLSLTHKTSIERQNSLQRPYDVLGTTGKPRMPSPPPDRKGGEQGGSSGLKKLRDRLSRTFGASNEYTNASEIEKLQKQGRASAKISAYQVKNIVGLFEQNERKTGSLGQQNGLVPKQRVSKQVSDPIPRHNGVVLRVHNLARARGTNQGKLTNQLNLQNSALVTAIPRPQSTHSVDSEGYMRPVLYPSSHASYIDLIPETKNMESNMLNGDNYNSPGNGTTDLYARTLPGTKC